MKNLFRDRESRQDAVAYWIGAILGTILGIALIRSVPAPVAISWQKIVLMSIVYVAFAVGLFVIILRLERFPDSAKKKKG